MTTARQPAPEAAAQEDLEIVLCSADEISRIRSMLVGATMIAGWTPSHGTQIAYGMELIGGGITEMETDPDKAITFFRAVCANMDARMMQWHKVITDIRAAQAPRPEGIHLH